jgi:hypothetical protein
MGWPYVEFWPMTDKRGWTGEDTKIFGALLVFHACALALAWWTTRKRRA